MATGGFPKGGDSSLSFAYMPFFTGDYIRDTRHLSPLKHGIYFLLLMHCWDQKGPLPLDDQECAGIANCRSADEIDALRYVMGRYFIKMDDGWYNARMQKEIEKSENISRARSEAGFKGYQARAKQVPTKRQANAKHLHLTPSPSPSLSSTPSPKSEALALTPPGIRADAQLPVIEIPLNDKTGFGINAAMVKEFEGLYPAVDVMQTLREIRGWNRANPDKRKTRSGVMRHVNQWLAKEQNRG